MKIRTKILILFTLGAVVPLLLSHFFAMRMVSHSIKEHIQENMSLTATQTSGRVGDHLERSVQELSRSVNAIPFADFPPQDLPRALEIPYRQIAGATTIALLDENGIALTPPYKKGDKEALALEREPVSLSDLKSFEENIPLKLALTAEVAIGPVYLSSVGTPRMVMASAYRRGNDHPPWVLAAEVSLQTICSHVEINNHLKTRHASLIDALGRNVCEDLEEYPGNHGLNSSTGHNVTQYIDQSGEPFWEVTREVIVAGWKLVLRQPESIAMEPVERSVYWTALWVLICLVLALCGGAVLARELTKPISELEKAASQIASGNYENRLKIYSKDELGSLAEAFNQMSGEIETWNTELKKRVDEQTRALREAEEQILESKKLAAVGELGSGVAHEINNPLTSVIGVAQLMRGTAEPKTELHTGLTEIVDNARKVADIVDTLLKFSQSQVLPNMQPVDAGKVLAAVVETFETRFSKKNIILVKNIEPDCHIFAAENDLRLAFNHIVDNGIKAIPTGGKIEAAVSHVEGGAVLISITDNGSGMPEEIRSRAFDPFYTTRNPGSSARGLGLPLVYNIVKEHDGRIVIDSSLETGTRVKIYLPGATRLSRD